MEVKIPIECLNKIYTQQLKILRSQINKMSQVGDIDLSGKWLKIFQRVANSEKLARNYLVNLMSHQLTDQGYLSAPFTDLRNLKRNLQELLDELSNELIDTSTSSSKNSFVTFRSHYLNGPPMKDFEVIESSNEAMRAKNAILRRELEDMRLKLLEKDVEKSKLKSQLETARLDLTKRNTNLKNCLLVALNNAILEVEKGHLPEHLFENIVKEYTQVDCEVLSAVRQLDKNFYDALTKLIEKKLAPEETLVETLINDSYKKSARTLSDKYAQRLKVQTWTQRFQNKIIKLKCYSMLRNVFVHSKTKDELALKLLKLLEQEFQQAINDLF